MPSVDDYMRRALFHAERGRGRTSPNPMVGAVVVGPDGVIVGQGFHERAGTPHAEVVALDAAGDRARGSTLYCTLEPCVHIGRTGPCAARIVSAGVARVVVSVEDPNPLVEGRGFAYLRAHGVEVVVGPGAVQATRLNQPFFTRFRERRPFVILKAAISLDGAIADRPGVRTMLTSAAANRHAQRQRAEVDAIAVGVGTIVADDPVLTVRDVFRSRPLARVVFDRRLRTPRSARVLSTRESGPVIIMTTEQGAGDAAARRRLESAGATVCVATDGALRTALVHLASMEIESLLLEGGAAIHAAALREDVVDVIQLYLTPHVAGERGVRFAEGRRVPLAALVEPRIVPLGVDVLIEGYVHGPH